MTTTRTLLPAHTLPRRVTAAMTATVALAAAGLPLAAVLGLGAAPAAAQPPPAGTISTIAGNAGAARRRPQRWRSRPVAWHTAAAR